MPTNDQIEQLLRASFPFAADGFFRCEGKAYYLMSAQATISLNCHSPYGVFAASWGAKLTTENNPWTLAANEGSTPEEALSNLQVAIAQVGVIAATTEDAAKL
jgi:hypothetical protein